MRKLKFKNHVQFYEFNKKEWTFHMKGFWYENYDRDNSEFEYLTIIGSSNYNKRWALRDLETQFWFFVNDAKCVKDFEKIKRSIYQESRRVDQEIF